MASGGPTYFDRKGSSVARPAAAEPGAAPSSPHTPPRGIASGYSSPGGYRTDEEPVVFEFGSRHLRVGFAGQSAPRLLRPELLQGRAGELADEHSSCAIKGGISEMQLGLYRQGLFEDVLALAISM